MAIAATARARTGATSAGSTTFCTRPPPWTAAGPSAANAAPTTIQRTTSEPTLGVLDHDALEDVRRRLRGVDGVLEALEDVLPADDHHRVDAALEQRRQRLAHDAVALVLEPVDLDGEVVDVLEAAQAGDRAGERAARLVEHAGERLRLLHRRLDPVQREEVGDLLRVVHDVVQRAREGVDVLPVERGDERLVEALDDVVRDAVALLLADDHLPPQLAVVRPLLEHALQQLGRQHDIAPRLLEEVIELAL